MNAGRDCRGATFALGGPRVSKTLRLGRLTSMLDRVRADGLRPNRERLTRTAGTSTRWAAARCSPLSTSACGITRSTRSNGSTRGGTTSPQTRSSNSLRDVGVPQLRPRGCRGVQGSSPWQRSGGPRTARCLLRQQATARESLLMRVCERVEAFWKRAYLVRRGSPAARVSPQRTRTRLNLLGPNAHIP